MLVRCAPFAAQNVVSKRVPLGSRLRPNGSPSPLPLGPSLQVLARALAAINVFLNWFKLVALLSVSPVLGLTADTLGRAAHGCAGFGAMFLLVFGARYP